MLHERSTPNTQFGLLLAPLFAEMEKTTGFGRVHAVAAQLVKVGRLSQDRLQLITGVGSDISIVDDSTCSTSWILFLNLPASTT